MDDITIVVDYQQKGDPGPKGDDGRSAYQIAVDNGFEGTEAEWLLSLQGKDGTGGGGGSERPQDVYPTVNSTADVSSGGVYVRLMDKVDKTTTVNGQTLSANIVIDKTSIGLENVDNTSDVNKPVSTAQGTALNLKADKSTTVNGQPLNGNITLTKSDIGLANVDNTTDANKPVSTAQTSAIALKADKTITVNGQSLASNVTLSKSDVSLGNVDNTSDATKPVSTPQATALGLKVDKATTVNSKPLTGNITLDKTDVGLANVDNTADIAKPVSTAQATAIALKVDKTITVNSQPLTANVVITPSTLGLGNVNNTADADKPISTAEAAALSTKADLAGGKVPDAQLPTRTFGSSFYGAGSDASPLQVIDPLVEAWQYLGSTIKGWVVGLNPYMAASSALTLGTGFYYFGMIRVFGAQTLTGVSWMLAATAVGFTASNENRIGLYTYNKAGVLTQVAATANNAGLYTQTAGAQLQEAFSAPYPAADGFYFLTFIYSTSTTPTTVPSLAASTFSLPNKVTPLTTNSAKIQGRSTSAGKTALPSSITFSTDTVTVNNGFLAGVY